MRHAVLALLVAAALLLAWRIRALATAGEELHERELAARGMAERILRAEEERRIRPPADAVRKPYDYLGTLVAERRIDGLAPVAGGDRERFVAGGYVFHVRLLNKLGRPLPRPPADGSDGGLGLDFELWAWPADAGDAALPLFFGSDAGYLLQGDNGAHAGLDARPEDVAVHPAREVERVPGGATDQWIVLKNIRDP